MTKIPIVSSEEMKIKEEKEKKVAVYDKEYRDALAKRLGFKSSEEYEKYKYEKKKEKLEKIEERVAKAEIEDETAKIKRERAEIKAEILEEQKRLAEIRRLEKEKHQRQRLEEKRILGEHIIERDKLKEKILTARSKKKLCKSLQDIISEVKDPNSILKDLDLVREYTGCPIPIKKKEKK